MDYYNLQLKNRHKDLILKYSMNYHEDEDKKQVLCVMTIDYLNDTVGSYYHMYHLEQYYRTKV